MARLPESGASDALYLVDLSGYVFRAYHALPPLSSSKGEPTHAVIGTVNMLQKVVAERRPHMMAVAMDTRGRTFRHEVDARYKATRPAPPPDLSQQMARVEQIKDFRILPKTLDPEEDGEPVTPTRKVKRHLMYERFKSLVEAMYDDREQRVIEGIAGPVEAA